MRQPILAAAAVGAVVLVSSCASPGPSAQAGRSPSAPAPASPASAQATVQATVQATAPAGYQRVGGVTQGISVAVPSSWTAINPTRQSLQQAVGKLRLSSSVAQMMAQQVQHLQSMHAVFAVDIASIAKTPSHFATNLNAYCSSSAVTESGSATVPLLRSEMKAAMQELRGHGVKETGTSVGGIPGLLTTYRLTTANAATLYAAQLEVLPKPGRACFITLTGGRRLPGALVSTVATSVSYP